MITLERTGAKTALTFFVGIDTGGTFTDLSVADGRGARVATVKVPSTPDDPSQAILTGLERVMTLLGVTETQIAGIAHGTTVSTNAMLERKGANTALLVTAGFRDLLAIARQNRPDLYDWWIRRPTPLVPRERTFEVSERTLHDGKIVLAPTDAELVDLVERVANSGAQAVAICLLHSYANRSTEQKVEEALAIALPGVRISASSELLPQPGEYERAATTVANAYLAPLIEEYLDRLVARLSERGVTAPVYVMQSNGGLGSVGAIRKRSVQTILSGPAAGVVAAVAVGNVASKPHLLSVDMGGTSFDVSLIPDRQIALTSEATVDGIPVSTPSIQIHTLGAGGGSIAWIDDGGALRVGPMSAGATPGPAAYGQGGEQPTVTDANLVLGRLGGTLLGGSLLLDRDAARQAIDRTLAGPLQISIEEAALGIIRVVNAEMARGMRLMSVSRGYDPRDLALVAFGGAGPLHAADLADDLGIGEVIVPPAPGATSALGLLLAGIRREFSEPVLEELGEDVRRRLEESFGRLADRATAYLRSEGVVAEEIVLVRRARLAYSGQAYDVEVDAGGARETIIDALGRRFEAEHRRRFGYLRRDPIRIASVTVSGVGRVFPAAHSAGGISRPGDSSGPAAKPAGTRRVRFREGWHRAGVHARSDLRVSAIVAGPAVVEQLDATTLIPPTMMGCVAGDGSIVLTPRDGVH